jgi:8-oxo-dGTP diphosphatase
MIHAVKALIYNSKYQILLQQRDFTMGIPFPGHWTFFGGQVEEKEDYKEALIREIWEELSWEPKIIEDEIFS